jgi:membrane associated rhomboid family serine protease
MGLYDRDYYRQQRSSSSFPWPQTIVGTLVLINVALFLIDWIFWPDNHLLTYWLAASDRTLFRPWMWWQFLTYGFVHSPMGGEGPGHWHIIGNMLGLWFLGRRVEELYGRWEFLRIYLLMIVVGGLVWGISVQFTLRPEDPRPILLGASGGVSGIVMLFVFNWPQATLILFPIPIPVRAWVIGVLLVAWNIYGSVAQVGNTAFGVHLVGIAIAYLYFHHRWNFGRLTRGPAEWLQRLRRPTFRVHHPDDESDHDHDARQQAMEAEVDRILEKIYRQGEASLTRQERHTLEQASRRAQQRRRE